MNMGIPLHLILAAMSNENVLFKRTSAADFYTQWTPGKERVTPSQRDSREDSKTLLAEQMNYPRSTNSWLGGRKWIQ
ncbi:hypothetical protein C7293_22715 [filamentous cyanobacterium CCT1]|nr:hypothetical protein C7293_22715 [filamentous cyanobacterium CCT1]PSN78700.1 hypothetical protein C8B47_15520 [filamentous cyanobacterium CCP4]